jgi:hypothetical protein
VTIANANGEGVANSKTAGTTLVIPSTADFTTGNFAVVVFSSDDAAGTFSIADDQGNTWVECKNQLNAGSVRLIVWASILTTGITGNVTVTHPSLTARAGLIKEFSGVLSATPDQTNSATGVTAAFDSGSVTPTEDGELLIGAIGWEGVIGDNPGSVSGFTVHLISATSGGGAASNIGEASYHQIQTTATADAFDGALANARDWAAAIVSFKEIAATAVLKRRPSITQQAVMRAATW